MNNEDKYFAVLSDAMGRVNTESFEARGVVYDRLWEIVLNRLQDEPYTSDESIANERRAFLAAVQRIEFGERLPAVAREQPEGITPETEPIEPDKPKRRPPRRRIVLRMVSACALLLLLGGVYLFIRFDSTSAADWINENPHNALQIQFMRAVIAVHSFFERQPPAVLGPRQKAVLYEENSAIASGSTYAGHAIWRMLREGKGGKTEFLSIDVEIPQKDLVLKMELRPAADKGGVISHLIEFRFLSAKGTLSEAVQDVLGVLMKNDELSPGIELIGKVTRVRPGMFLMGLSGAAADVETNLKLLRDRPWLDIPVVFRGGARSLIAIEKGTTGQSAINALR
jgi:hypothetical protein